MQWDGDYQEADGSAEQVVHHAGGVAVHRRCHVRVHIEGDGDRGVTEHLADDIGVDAAAE